MFKKLRKKISSSVSRRRLEKLAKKGKVKTVGGQTAKKGTYSKAAQKRKAKHTPGMEKTGKVSKGAVSAVGTKGGTYVKYEKKSKSAKSFRSAFKSSCSGEAKSFSWQGRSYSCAKKSDKPKKTQVTASQAKKDMAGSRSTNYNRDRSGGGPRG